ncbi:MAG: HAMP domain-containing protein, partial [Rickettsiaceae bacterium]|nr:HAMP domain-containing protein [Rickettsiaceae bacterium]
MKNHLKIDFTIFKFLGRKINICISILSLLSIFLFWYILYCLHENSHLPELIYILFISLIILLSLIILVVLRWFKSAKIKQENFRLRARIILMFSLIAAVPTILVSAFSIMIFNFGIEAWFDKDVSTAVTQSARVANIYISQNKIQLRESLLSIAEDLNLIYLDIPDETALNKLLNAHAEMRNITDAIIFDRNSKRILGLTSMNFGLSLWTISYEIFDKLNKDMVAEINDDPGKLKMIVRLKAFPGETYLMVSNLIDEETVNYVNQTAGAAIKYKNLINRKMVLQINLALIFIGISAVIIIATITVGWYFGSKIVSPVKKLVEALEKVRVGDLNLHIEYNNSKRDELVILTEAFNKMLKRLDIQQKDLAIAHRSIAWNDVARRVAHEIKNPLTPIALCAERLAKKITLQIGEDQE